MVGKFYSDKDDAGHDDEDVAGDDDGGHAGDDDGDDDNSDNSKNSPDDIDGEEWEPTKDEASDNNSDRLCSFCLHTELPNLLTKMFLLVSKSVFTLKDKRLFP